MRSKRWAFAALLTLSGCGLNRAIYDPWSYAPEDPYWYWSPDKQAGDLSCESPQPIPCPDLPPEGHETSLAEILNIALFNNTSTQITWAEARQAAAQYGESQAYIFPSITGDFGYTRVRAGVLSSTFTIDGSSGPDTLLIYRQSLWGPQLQLTYNIFDFGQRRATSEAARYTLYYANYTHNWAIQTLLQTIITDYYNVLYQQKLLEAFEKDLFDTKETLDAADLGLRTGVKDVSDMLQAKSQFLQVSIQLSEQKQQVYNAYTQMLMDMGLPATQKIDLQKLPIVNPDDLILPSLDSYINMAMQMRPDLLAARASMRSAEESLTAAERLPLPNLDYSLDFGRTYFNNGHLNDGYDYTSTFTLSMPIFSGFWYRNNIKQAEAAERQAEANLRQVELAAIQQVSSAHHNVSVSLEVLRASYVYLAAAAEQFKVALAEYKAGTGTILEVTNAQSALFDARAKQASSIKGWFDALSTLAYSTGTLSQPPTGDL